MVDQDNSNSSDQLRVDIIDVGQGDSILLEGPNGSTMLIDSGPYQNHGERVFEHLDAHDVDHLDHLVATHYDADHIGGHPEIIEAFGSDGIGTIHGPDMEGVKNPDSDTMDRYGNALEEAGMEIYRLQDGKKFDLDGATVDVLNPSPEIDSTDRNENSVVFQVTHEDQSILLAGDTEGKAEAQLFEQYSDQLGTVDAVKAAHHGSDNGTGPTTITGTNPTSIFLSSSLTNRHWTEHEYNAHPHDEMLKHVHDHGEDIDLYWTPVHGTTSITIATDAIQIGTARGDEALTAADVLALKYYGRDNDLDNEQLTEIEGIDPADLPEEVPEWVEETALITGQALDEAEPAAQSPESDGQEPPIEQLKGEIQQLTEKFQKRDEMIQKLNEENADLRDQNLDLREEALDLREENLDLRETVQDLKATSRDREDERESEQATRSSEDRANMTDTRANGGAETDESATSPTGDEPTDAPSESEQADDITEQRSVSSQTQSGDSQAPTEPAWVEDPSIKPGPDPDFYEQWYDEPPPEELRNGNTEPTNENDGPDRADERDGRDDTDREHNDDDPTPGGLG